jgi:hypothetical protein
MIISKSTGMFGPLWVLDYDGTRLLTIKNQVQGSCYLAPAGPEGLVPGPVAASPYMTGWLLAGAQNPHGSGLMIGLGSGCGAVAMLNSCPGLDLTVVEIDPAIIAAALTGFPLLDYYQNQGRLHIVTSDATAYAQEAIARGDQYDLALLDAYQGSNDLHVPDELLYAVSQCCTHLWLNSIDVPGGAKVTAVASCLELLGKPIVGIYPITGGAGVQNIILTTQPIDPGLSASFVAYPDCPADHHITAARAAVQALAAS